MSYIIPYFETPSFANLSGSMIPSVIMKTTIDYSHDFADSNVSDVFAVKYIHCQLTSLHVSLQLLKTASIISKNIYVLIIFVEKL